MINKFCKTPLWEASMTLAATAQGGLRRDRGSAAQSWCKRARAKFWRMWTWRLPCGPHRPSGDAPLARAGHPRTGGGGQYIAPVLPGRAHPRESVHDGRGEYAACLTERWAFTWIPTRSVTCGPRGREGVEEDAARTPLKTMITTPCRVPAVPGFEDTGRPSARRTWRDDGMATSVVGRRDDELPGYFKLRRADPPDRGGYLRQGRSSPATIPCPRPEKGLNAYIASELLLPRVHPGGGTRWRRCAWECTPSCARAPHGMTYTRWQRPSRNTRMDTRYANLVSDDAHPETLIHEGHLDHIVRRAVQEGSTR